LDQDRRAVEVRVNVAGVALVLATAGWLLLSAGDRGSAGPVVGLLVLSSVGYLAAFAVGRLLTPLLPAALVVGAAGAAVFLSTGPRGPLGYENANGVFFVLAAVAALMIWAAMPRQLLGVVALVVGVLFGILPLADDVLTSAVTFVFVAGIAVAALRGQARGAVMVSAAAFIAVLLGTIVLGLTYSGQSTRLTSALTERRLELWHDALVIVGEHPAAGAGLDRFEELSPTARSDRDARWAHHEFLQLGAETGVPGLALLVSLFAWGFVRLAVGRSSTGGAIAAGGLAAAGMAASVDYVFHFAAVPIAAAVLLGAGVASGPKG
jgi:O-antigen ligase